MTIMMMMMIIFTSSRDPVVANAWLETLLDAIDLLPLDVIRQEIVTIAVAKSQLSQPAFSRFPLSSATNFIFTQFWRDQAVSKHFIYTSTHLGRFCVVGHDVRVRDVDPVVVLAVHRAAVLGLV